MRSYFDFDLKGKQLFPYMTAAWVVMVGMTVVSVFRTRAHPEPAIFFDRDFLNDLLTGAGTGLLTNLAWFLAAFFIVTCTLKAVSLRGEGFTCEHSFREYAWLCVKGSLLTITTCGIYLPWFLTKAIRWFASNTYFRFNEFGFDASAMNLFSYMILLIALPAALFFFAFKVALLSLFAGGDPPGWFYPVGAAMYLAGAMFWAACAKWFLNFSYGPKRITGEVKFWHSAWFLFGQTLLTIITAGFYGPMAMLRIYRYYVGRLILGETIVEDRFGFSMSPWRDYLFMLGQSLLTVITLGIYAPWAFARMSTRLMRQSYVEVVEEKRIPMPRST